MSGLGKRSGRSIKEPKPGKRAQITLLVRPEIKRTLVRSARANTRTLSQEGEMVIERCLVHDRTLAAMNKTMEQIKRGNLEGALWREGYRPVRSVVGGKAWKVWAEPGYPGIDPGGFEPWKEGEARPEPVELPPEGETR
jgi:hypothetical protein